jgi:hypothetical protein
MCLRVIVRCAGYTCEGTRRRETGREVAERTSVMCKERGGAISYIILQEAKTESGAVQYMAPYSNQSNSHCGWVCRVKSLKIGLMD